MKRTLILLLVLGISVCAMSQERKSIAVLGGSLSSVPESEAAKHIWEEELGVDVVTYGVGGAGFSSEQGYTLQRQAREAGVHDVYVLWASTNDYKNNRACGSWKDFTEQDGLDSLKLTTQCGGINACIRTLQEKNPKAVIVFFTSLRFFGSEDGWNPFSEVHNATGLNFADYVQAQKEGCAHFGVPLLDQFAMQAVNPINAAVFYKSDLLHMTEEGYARIAPLQVEFLRPFIQ